MSKFIAPPSRPWSQRTVQASTSAANGEYLLVDTSNGAVAVAAPTPAKSATFGVKWIKGAAAPTLTGAYSAAGTPLFVAVEQAMEFISDGTAWYRQVRPALAQLPDWPATGDARYPLASALATVALTGSYTDLLNAPAAGSGASTTTNNVTYDVQAFAATGNFTWTKPVGALRAAITLIGAGGGGGGGGITSGNTFGGNGGQGGGAVQVAVDAATLSATVTGSIGAGGAGGTGGAYSSNPGVAGTGGGATTFGSWTAAGGGGGAGGPLGTAPAIAAAPPGGGGQGGQGGGTSANTGSPGSALLTAGGGGGGYGGTGGGGGGGAAPPGATATAGGTLTAAGSSASTSLPAGVIAGAGGGGGGGYQNTTTGATGGPGGNGYRGGGGGGGGYSYPYTVGQYGGSGGNGGNGYALIITECVVSTIVGSSGLAAAIPQTTWDIKTYDAAGSFTWTRPTGATEVYLTLVGAGGGGGGGGTSYSGGGGGGGAREEYLFRAADLAATVPVTVGAGGAGGAVSSGLNGTNGGGGGASSFGASYTAAPGTGAVGGASPAAGVGGAGTLSGGNTSYRGAGGAPGGPVGAGITSSGSPGLVPLGLAATAPAGGAVGTGSTAPGYNGGAGAAGAQIPGAVLGTSGAAGGGSANVAGAVGGAGGAGAYGAGGGGGGNGVATGGVGGRGGDGVVIVRTLCVTAVGAAPGGVPALPASDKGAPGGVATLDGTGQVPVAQLGNVPAGPTILTAAKQTDTAVTSNTTKAADPELVVTVPAAGKYLVELSFGVQTGGSFQWAIGGTANPAAVGNSMGRAIYNASGSTDPTQFLQNLVSSGPSIGANGEYLFTASQVVSVTAAGTVALAWGQSTSSATATTLHAGSFLRATKVG